MLRVRWQLQANDRIAASHDFPSAGGSPYPVLRVLREDDAAAPIETVRLRLSEQRSAGDMSFRAEPDAAGWKAELGLVNAAGGWLLLARSNRLLQAAAIGLAFPNSANGGSAPAATDPTLDSPSATLLPTFPFAQLADVPAPESARSTAALFPRSLTSPYPSGIGSPFDTAGDRAATDDSPAAPPRASASIAAAGNGGAICRVPEQVATADDGANGRGDPGNATLCTSRIPVLVYDRPTPQRPGLLIEAELRIHGWGTPNTDIDLFGHRYRIGPGGRFQFVLRVDDQNLLRQALLLHPPPELARVRDA